MTIYVDLYFILNFALDLLVILLCKRILGYRRRFYRTLFAAFLGALYAVAVLPFSHPAFWILHLVFGSFLPLIALGFGNLRRFLRLLLYFYGINFFLGGALSAAYRGYAMFIARASAFHFSIVLVLLLALLAGIYCLFFGNITRTRPGKHVLTVTLTQNEKKILFQGYADTGNLLRDPLENLPVLLANASLSRKIYSFYTDGKVPPDPRNAYEAAFYENLPLRMIPCQTVTGKSLLPALKVQAEIEGQTLDICIALHFTRTADYCGFDALIPINLL